MSSWRARFLGTFAGLLGLALIAAVTFTPYRAGAAYQGLPPQWQSANPIPPQAQFLADVNCNNPPPDQMPVITTGLYWARLGERTPGRSVNRRDEFRINLKARQLVRLHLYPEGANLLVSVSRVTTTASGRRVRHIYHQKYCRNFANNIAEVNFTPQHDGEYRISVANAPIRTPLVRYVLEVEVIDNPNPTATHQCGGQPAPDPGITKKVTHAVQGWSAGNGRSEWSYDSTTGLVRVWAHTYADVIDQIANPDWKREQQETVKVLDYQTFTVTGIPGAIYRCNISALLELKGIVDRMDYTLAVGASATQYHVELVWGLAETTSPYQIDKVYSLRSRVWQAANNLWEDLAWDITFAVASAGLSFIPGSSVYPILGKLGTIVSYTFTVLPIMQDKIQADAFVANRYRVNFNNAIVQAGKTYMVYAMLIARVRTVSMGMAAGVCELDFWYRAPYLCEKEGHDAMGGRGFKLKSYQVTFAKIRNQPPCAPQSPQPAEGQQVIPQGSSQGPQGSTILLQWQGGDPNGEIVLYDLYWGTVNPPPLFARDLLKTESQVWVTGQQTYYWRVVATNQKGNKTEGPLWRFTTSTVNHAPLLYEALTPRDQQTNVSVNTVLAWRASDPDRDPLTYEVTLTRSGSGTTISLGPTTNNSISPPSPLEPGAHYSWTVKAKDGRGRETSRTYSFTTAR